MTSDDGVLAPDRLADQVELILLPTSRRVNRARIDQVLRKLQPDVTEDQLERNVESAVSRIRERATLIGAQYPLRFDNGAFRRGDKYAQAVAEFLALLSAYPATRRRTGGHKPDLQFERLTAAAVARYTGGDAYVYSELLPGRGMRAKLVELGNRIGVESFPGRARPERFDNGLDVVGWRKFPGRGPVFPVVLVQCTVGAADPIAKARETSERDWGDLLDIPTAAFITAFAIPHVLPLDWRRWRDLRNATELALDRVRLMHLLTEADCAALSSAPGFESCLEYMRTQVPPEARLD